MAGSEQRGPKIFMIPKNHVYITRLKKNLEDVGFGVVILKPFHYSTFINLFKIIKYRLQGFKAIHVHWMYIFPAPFVMKGFYYMCRVMGIKIIWEMHNIEPHKCSERKRSNSRWFYERVAAVIFHSKSDVARSRKILGTSVKKMHIVIPLGNFNDIYKNTISRDEARKRLKIPVGKRVILCFGFLRKNRGYEYLIKATEKMKDTLVVVAGGVQDNGVLKMLGEYEKKTPNLRLYCRYIPDDEVQVFFNACDIVVLPYTDITTSGVIPLSYAFARPVVSSEIGGIKEVVTEKTGVLAPKCDADALKKAIERLFNADYEAMGREAQTFAEREFNWQANAKKIKDLYEAL